jgi:hypothetical protein
LSIWAIGVSFVAMNRLFFLSVLFFLSACTAPKPEEVALQVWEKSGGARAEHARITFDLHDQHYDLTNDGGLFDWQRTIYADMEVVDKWHNYGLQRFVSDTMQSISDERAAAIKQEIDSTVQLFHLPRSLPTAPANTNLTQELWQDVNYWRMTADGTTWWIHPDSATIDYMSSAPARAKYIKLLKVTKRRYVNGIQVCQFHVLRLRKTGNEMPSLNQYLGDSAPEVIDDCTFDNVTISLLDE